jgi:hypothetical protein
MSSANNSIHIITELVSTVSNAVCSNQSRYTRYGIN